jgi:hypothetical protein
MCEIRLVKVGRALDLRSVPRGAISRGWSGRWEGGKY